MKNSIQNPEKGIALYYQVENSIREKIENGEWKVGQKLPTEPELCQFFGVSRTTIRQAVDSLVSAGLLAKKQGSGTYVTQATTARNHLNFQPSNIVCQYIYSPFLQSDMEHCYKNLLLTNIAHITMLHKQRLLAKDEARSLLQFIIPLMDMHPQTIGYNPVNEDYLLNFEEYITRNLSAELNGKMQVARSRNDMTPTILRMSIRDELLILLERLLYFMQQLRTLAEQNQGKIFTGYTHCMPAQPITLDFYFLAIAEAVDRDFNRILSAYPTLNQSPLGSCALAGTSFSIDREYTASLLGFDGIIVNALDAVASRDYLLELASHFSTLGSTLSRFAQDLYTWSSAECSYLSISDAYSCCSSIMPQKKNALSLEHIRSKTSHLTSSYIDILMCLKGTSFSHSRDLFECMTPYWQMTNELRGILELFIGTLDNITFHYDRMEVFTAHNDSVLTDIADFLVQKDHISFRSAHNIISNISKSRNGIADAPISLRILNNASIKISGKKTSLTHEELMKLQSPIVSIQRKQSSGSPSSQACQTMLQSAQIALQKDTDQLNTIRTSLRASRNYRQEQINQILNID